MKRTGLARPRWLGRIVRLSAGLSIGILLWLTSPAEIKDPDGLFWFLVAMGLWMLPEVVAISGNRVRPLRLQAGAVIVGLALAASDALWFGEFWWPLLGWACFGLLLIVNGLWAISFVLSGLLPTPGCEWGAIPHLIERARGRDFEGRPCSLGLDRLDAWQSTWGRQE